MMKKFMPYRWIAYIIGWYAFQFFPVYFRMTHLDEEFITFLFCISAVVIAIFSYEFSLEKGKGKGVSIFILCMIIEALVAFFTFIFLLGMSWHNQFRELIFCCFYVCSITEEYIRMRINTPQERRCKWNTLHLQTKILRRNDGNKRHPLQNSANRTWFSTHY